MMAGGIHIPLCRMRWKVKQSGPLRAKRERKGVDSRPGVESLQRPRPAPYPDIIRQARVDRPRQVIGGLDTGRLDDHFQRHSVQRPGIFQ